MSGRSWRGRDARYICRALGMTEGLQICLDAGARESFDGSGQVWNDLSGNGFDFYRGTGSGAQSADPTFAGAAGRLSAGEYFSFDGGDVFQLGQSNPPAIDDLHRNGTTGLILAWLWLDTTSGFATLAGNRGSNSNTGWSAQTNNGTLQYAIRNSGTLISRLSELSIEAGRWNCIGFQPLDPLGVDFFVNGIFDRRAGDLAGLATGGGSVVMEIGSSGGQNALLPSGSRLGMFLLWGGIAVPREQVMAFYQATRGRFAA